MVDAEGSSILLLVTDYGFRYYNPETGRWASRDPIGERGGLNLYAFLGNDWVNQWDYIGLSKKGFSFEDLIGDSALAKNMKKLHRELKEAEAKAKATKDSLDRVKEKELSDKYNEALKNSKNWLWLRMFGGCPKVQKLHDICMWG